jgi:phosphoribosylformylglycinamidine cyclo-ligase
VARDEMLRVWNLGIGMVVVVDRASADELVATLARGGAEPAAIGAIETGGEGVVYRDRVR